jgi:ATP-dependent Lhr-like helicase
MLARIRGSIAVCRLRKVSPLAVPVLLEIGREQVYGEAVDELLDLAARDLIEEATAEDTSETVKPGRLARA